MNRGTFIIAVGHKSHLSVQELRKWFESRGVIGSRTISGDVVTLGHQSSDLIGPLMILNQLLTRRVFLNPSQN